MYTPPQCPKCGCPARNVLLRKAKVRCVLNNDGTIGKVMSCSREKDTIVGYECGFKHIFSCESFELNNEDE